MGLDRNFVLLCSNSDTWKRWLNGLSLDYFKYES